MTIDDPVSVAGGVQSRRRLHPLSPLLNSAKILAGLLAVSSIQGFVQLGWPNGLWMVLLVMLGGGVVSVVSWLVTGYHVVGRELRVHDGVLVRRTRAIPLERLQSVEVVRPVLARLSGLAELRLEVVGGGKTEAPLAFLTVAEAGALRERLLALARGQQTAAEIPAETAVETSTETETSLPGAAPPPSPVPQPTAPAPPVAEAPPAEQPLHRVVNREVLVSQLLTPQMMFLPVGIVLVVTQYLFRTTLSLVVLLSAVAAVVGVVQQPVRRILSDWNFRLSLQDPPAPGPPADRHRPGGLRVRHGLTETRSQTVPLHRVQAMQVIRPLLWRHRRWIRCRLDIAGIALPNQNGAEANHLLPVGDLATAGTLAEVVLPGVNLTALRPIPPPARARWLAPIRAPILGATLADQVFATRDGRLTRTVVVVPYARIQSVRVTQGPVQRQLGMATVSVDTAGSLTATAHHRALAEARWLAGELTERARAARGAG